MEARTRPVDALLLADWMRAHLDGATRTRFADDRWRWCAADAGGAPAALLRQNAAHFRTKRLPPPPASEDEDLLVRRPFDESRFSFLGARPAERMATMRWDGAPEADADVLVNVSPLAAGHCVVCPDMRARLPQVLTASAASLMCSLAAAAEFSAVMFNSLAAGATVNHLHLHLVPWPPRLGAVLAAVLGGAAQAEATAAAAAPQDGLPATFPVLFAPSVAWLDASQRWSGLRASLLCDPFPVHALLLSMPVGSGPAHCEAGAAAGCDPGLPCIRLPGSEAGAQLAAALQAVVDCCLRRGVAHNIVCGRRDGDRDGSPGAQLCAIVFLRRCRSPHADAGGFRVAVAELSGLVTWTDGAFESAGATSVCRAAAADARLAEAEAEQVLADVRAALG